MIEMSDEKELKNCNYTSLLIKNKVQKRAGGFLCPFCPNEKEKNVTRIRKHLANHFKINSENLGSYKTICEISSRLQDLKETNKEQGNSHEVLDLTDRNRNQKGVNEQELNKLLLLSVIISNCPLSYIDNDVTRQLFSMLGYTLPYRKHFSTKVLPELYGEIHNKVDELISNSNNVFLCFDGTKDITGQKLQCIVVIIKKVPFFYGLFDFSSISENGRNLSNMIECVRTKIGKDKVRGVIHDACPANIACRNYYDPMNNNWLPSDFLGNTNEIDGSEKSDSSNMSKSNDIYEECEEQPIDDILDELLVDKTSDETETLFYDPDNEFISFSCSAHQIELVLGDVLSSSLFYKHNFLSIKKFLDDVVVVANAFKNNSVFRNYLSDITNSSYVDNIPSLPNNTRWWSHYSSVNWISKNIINLSGINSHYDLGKEVSSILNNPAFMNSITPIMSIIQLFKDAVMKLEADDVYIGEIYGIYSSLLKSCDNNMFDPYSSTVSTALKRRETYFCHGIYQLAYCLDKNNFNEVHEDISLIERASDYLDSLGPKGSVYKRSFAEYITNTTIFTNHNTYKSYLNDPFVSNYTFWSMYHDIDISKTALLLCDCPSSSASAERVWSILKNNKTPNRNRLSNDSLEKILYININRNSLKKFNYQ
ncbi:hypothetical protein WA158_007277 [Blastocystis sp. Blastoise]